MKSHRPSRVLLLVLAGSLASSTIFVSSCTVDENGLAVVGDDAGPDGSEPEGAPPANADGGDATIDGGGFADAQDGSVDAGDGANVTPGADAEAAAPDASDATVATDGAMDAALDAFVDAAADAAITDASGGPDAANDGGQPVDAAGDTAVPVDAADAGSDAGPDASPDAGSDASTPVTTVSIITNQLGAACADGATNGGCLATQCEDLTGNTGASTNTSLCLATLACALSSSTATTYCGMRQDTVDECYCGDDAFSDCQNGQSDGVCIAAEQAGFGSTVPATITGSYYDETTPSGLANFITNCMNAVTPCVTAAGLN